MTAERIYAVILGSAMLVGCHARPAGGAPGAATPPRAGVALDRPAGGPQGVRATKAKIHPALRSLEPGRMVEYFVRLRPTGRGREGASSPLQAFGTAGRSLRKTAPLTIFLVERADRAFAFRIVDAVWVRSRADAIRDLAGFPEVERIFPVPRLHLEEHLHAESHASTAPESAPGPSETTSLLSEVVGPNEDDDHLVAVGAPRAWSELGLAGSGVVIGFIDTGVKADHRALASRYRGAIDGTDDFNWIDFAGEPAALAPLDAHGHGTESAGAALGGVCDDGEAAAPVGVAPGASWIACRAVSDTSPIGSEQFVKCLDWMWSPTRSADAEPDLDKRPHVVNFSGYFTEGNEEFSTLVEEALGRLEAAGITFVHSAGNVEGDCPTPAACVKIDSPPGTSATTLTVGAVDNDGDWNRSACGVWNPERQKPDVVAPGLLVRTTRRGPAGSSGTCDSSSGTSLAAPLASGAAALVIQSNPCLARRPDLVREALRDADPTGIASLGCPMAVAPEQAYGRGRIDVLRAVKRASAVVCEE